MPDPADGVAASATAPEISIQTDARGNRIVEPGLPPIPPQAAPARPAAAHRAAQGKRTAFLPDGHVGARHSLKG